MIDNTRSRIAVAALGAFVLAYLGWQLLDWTPGSRQDVGDLWLLPLDAGAVYAAWRASLRCHDGHGGLRSFWRLIAIALIAETLGDVAQAIYDIGVGHTPYPSLADPLYLAFYPLLLLALLRVPVAPTTRAGHTKVLLDGATIVLGGGALVWYFVLGPTALAGGQSILAMAVSVAFPVGDLFLLAGLAAALFRHSPAALRTPLRVIVATVLLGIAADVLYGYGQLHGTYKPGDHIDALYVLEFALFALAGICQRPVDAGDPAAVVDGTRRPPSRASRLPYLSVATGLGLLLVVERHNSFFPDVSVVLIVTLLTALVAARQYFAQRELLDTEASLRESERLKDEFLSIVGHELRTPLTSIRGALGLLEGGVVGTLPAQATEMLAIAVANTDRLARLINDILDVERMASGRIELYALPVRASELVNQALQVVQAMADTAGVRLRAETPDITVSADADRAVQALVNLLGNAIKFSNRDVLVTVTVVGEREHEHERECGRERALFSVHDDGRGIPAEQLETIFERFRQIDASDAREKGGTGLGLPIARGIVEHHGGRMWAESERGHGSTFHFTLPLAGAQPAAPHVSPRDAELSAPAPHVPLRGGVR